MNYRVVYDVGSAGYTSWHFPALGLVFIAIGTFLVIYRKKLPGYWGKNPLAGTIFAFVFLGFSLFWTIGSFALTYGSHKSLSGAAQANQVSVVEGPVTRFKPMPKEGHALERFCVSGECFEYSDYVYTGGFNHTSSHGGPIREGLWVRVSHVDHIITKLEIAP